MNSVVRRCFFFDGATMTTTTEDDDDEVVFLAPPDYVLGRDECEELKNETIPRFTEEVLRSKAADVEWLRRTALRRGTADWKPLRPYWIANDGGDECGAEEEERRYEYDEDNYTPLILVSVSNPHKRGEWTRLTENCVPKGFHGGSGGSGERQLPQFMYFSEGGDDDELGLRVLTPALVWKHYDTILFGERFVFGLYQSTYSGVPADFSQTRR
mmetsp:Transcript_50464/g.60836  ORF Transcript_50464/g.60836 Transcript_50464/m.60836 type:complete len:213 (-) Transcript_50464:82-720(-)